MPNKKSDDAPTDAEISMSNKEGRQAMTDQEPDGPHFKTSPARRAKPVQAASSKSRPAKERKEAILKSEPSEKPVR
jgi:hypothetical protein